MHKNGNCRNRLGEINVVISLILTRWEIWVVVWVSLRFGKIKRKKIKSFGYKTLQYINKEIGLRWGKWY